jgi:hypothetical protein
VTAAASACQLRLGGRQDAPTPLGLPPYIAIPQPVMYGGAGFLGAALDPFAPGGNPGQANYGCAIWSRRPA